ncbi:VTT domain-containing protein [Clostridium estertheticum]|uniref:TVP38/TMEM64 family membrane protein n=1 Tax=Clostridium estertheticum TaxID=238834 RepID=A0AA47I530_9CLOT|nr:VTT domain-containing protein [Clostridium estertheticum]MBU3155879.1 VTT domain-containing protein [Clostridium estertheticum]MBU3200492.1 VTT domain-containing protein [Clostridium estertheticum]WAG59213.1 VTT domain-containing protein [Clostridium estertheticum]WAG66733.1 VTT domain-containing protein [Clostridium estertheticum]
MKRLKNKLNMKVVVIILAIISILVIFRYLPWIIEITISPEKFRRYIVSLGNWGIVAYLSFQVLQTVVAPIPGEVIQVAGGYIYGSVLGTFYSTLGMMLGGIIIFYFTRLIAFSFVEKIVKRTSTQWLTKIISSKKFPIVMFVMFIVPGMPKDLLIYMAALTPIKSLKFFILLLVGRLPGTAAVVCIGSNIHHKNYMFSIALVVVSVLLVILGILYKDKIINKFSEEQCNLS